MQEVTLALAILLGVGFVFAKIGQLVHLPSVTGYICAGLLLGPSGLGFVTHEAIEHNFNHFTRIALMLIAFGIGEHTEIKRLRMTAKTVGFIGVTEIVGAFLLVSVGSFLAAVALGVGNGEWCAADNLAFAILLGSVAIATAPATILHVIQEVRAKGPFTTTLMQVVAVNNGIAIVLFGVCVSLARHILGDASTSFLAALLASVNEIFSSLLLGVLTGLLIDTIVIRLKRRGEMLTVGLSLLLLCGEVARLLDFSSLLAGMAAGFTIINRAHRDVRLFRTLNAFEAPVYVLFFTLAGAHLDLSVLAAVGWIGIVYYLLRGLGKIGGASLGARLVGASRPFQQYMGLALVPQAGVAIGLILLIRGDAGLAACSSVINSVVLAGVFLSELTGPIFTRYALMQSGEAKGERENPWAAAIPESSSATGDTVPQVRLIPWNWEPLTPAKQEKGVVLFGAAHMATVAGLARMATLFAHYQEARPLSVRVELPGQNRRYNDRPQVKPQRFSLEKNEVSSLGYELQTCVVQDNSVAAGLLTVANERNAMGIILGYPLTGTAQEFERVVEAVTADAPCQVIVVRFSGILHTERILVPIVSRRDLKTVRSVIRALSGIGKHRITLIHLLTSDASKSDVEMARKKLVVWARLEGLASGVDCLAVPTEARRETIVKEAFHHDLLVMAATKSQGLQRLFFGSLAEGVARDCNKPMLMVHDPRI